jgi:hypothetical protein
MISMTKWPKRLVDDETDFRCHTDGVAHAIGYTGLLQKFVIRYEDSKTGIRNGIISPTS